MKFTTSLIFGIICLLSLNSFAQTWGVNAGTTFSKEVFGNDNGENEYKSGWQIGIIFEYDIQKSLQFETGLEIVSKGMKFSDVDNEYHSVYKTSLNYIDVPTAIKIKGKLYKDFDFFVKGGLYIGLGISGKLESSYLTLSTDYRNTNIQNVEWGDNTLNRIDYGPILGVGLEYIQFQIGVTYKYGLINVPVQIEERGNLYNRSFTILFGMTF